MRSPEEQKLFLKKYSRKLQHASMSDTIAAATKPPYFLTPTAHFVVIVIIINGGIHNNHNSNNIVWFATFPKRVVGYFFHYVGIPILRVTFGRPYKMVACTQRAVLGCFGFATRVHLLHGGQCRPSPAS